jgi:hypothetical protein
MKGGCLHRLLANKLCFVLVVLLAIPSVVLLLEGAPVLTIFSSTPEQLRIFSQGSLKCECYFNGVFLLPKQNLLSVLSADDLLMPLESGFLQQEQEHLGHDVSSLPGSSGPSSRSNTQRSRTKQNKGNQMLLDTLLFLFLSFSPLLLHANFLDNGKKSSGFCCKQLQPGYYKHSNCFMKEKQDQQFGWYKILAINSIAKSPSMVSKNLHGNCLHLATCRNECFLIMVMPFHLSSGPKPMSTSV